MNQTFDLNRIGFVEMRNEELMATDGGFWAELAAAAALIIVAPIVAAVGVTVAATSTNAY